MQQPLLRVLYRSLVNSAAEFHRASIPLTGVVGSKLQPVVLDPVQSLRHAFRVGNEKTTVQEVQHIRSQLAHQLQLLSRSEQHTRTALACWAQCLQIAGRSCSTPLEAAQHLHVAAGLTSVLTALPTTHVLDDDEVHQALHEALAAVHNAHRVMHTWAHQVYHHAPVYAVGSDGDMHIQPHALVRVLYDNIHRVMGRGGDGGGGGHHDDVGDSMVAGHTQQHTQQHIQQHTQHIQPSMEVLNKQFAALHEVLFVHLKLHQAPYEWVYDGLAPLRLVDVVERKKGLGFVLGTVAVAVGAHLGLPLRLLPTHSAVASVQQGPSHIAMLQQLPADVAARQMGHAGYFMPDTETWVVMPDYSMIIHAQHNNKQKNTTTTTNNNNTQGSMSPKGMYVLDTTRPGALIEYDPKTQPAWSQRELLPHMAEHCRLAMTAHQRRGESDSVAHWMYQLLALDAHAPEWRVV